MLTSGDGRELAACQLSMAVVLSLRPGDYPEHATVRAALADIHVKIADDYEDAGDSLRERMSRGIQPGELVVNDGQLDDGHRRAAIAQELGWGCLAVRPGRFGPDPDRDMEAGR